MELILGILTIWALFVVGSWIVKLLFILAEITIRVVVIIITLPIRLCKFLAESDDNPRVWAVMSRKQYEAKGRKYIEEMVANYGSIMDLKYIDSLAPVDYVMYGRQLAGKKC